MRTLRSFFIRENIRLTLLENGEHICPWTAIIVIVIGIEQDWLKFISVWVQRRDDIHKAKHVAKRNKTQRESETKHMLHGSHRNDLKRSKTHFVQLSSCNLQKDRSEENRHIRRRGKEQHSKGGRVAKTKVSDRLRTAAKCGMLLGFCTWISTLSCWLDEYLRCRRLSRLVFCLWVRIQIQIWTRLGFLRTSASGQSFCHKPNALVSVSISIPVRRPRTHIHPAYTHRTLSTIDSSVVGFVFWLPSNFFVTPKSWSLLFLQIAVCCFLFCFLSCCFFLSLMLRIFCFVLPFPVTAHFALWA